MASRGAQGTSRVTRGARMANMSLRRACGVAALLVFLLSGGPDIRAEIITYEYQGTLDLSGGSNGAAYGAIELNIPQFDPRMGSLTGLDLWGGFGIGQYSFDVRNDDDHVGIVIWNSDMSSYLSLPNIQVNRFTEVVPSHEFSLEPGDTRHVDTSSAGAYYSFHSTNLDLSPYIGQESVTATLGGVHLLSLVISSGLTIVDFHAPTSASYQLAVTYTFTASPEPSSLAVLGLSAVIVVTLGRRSWPLQYRS